MNRTDFAILIGIQILVFMFFFTSGVCSKTLNMGYFILPPFHMQRLHDDKKPEGAGIEYFEMIAHKIGYKVKWTGLPLIRLTDYISSGKIDGTVTFPKFPVFEAFMYYPDVPMFFGQPIFVVTKDSPLQEIRSIEDIKGFHIGLVKSKSNRYLPLIDQNRDKIFLEERPSMEWVKQNLNKLLNGRLDAFFDRQQYSIPFVAKTINLDDKIKIIQAPVPANPFYIVLSKKVPGNQDVLQKINSVLINDRPDFQRLLDKQFELLE